MRKKMKHVGLIMGTAMMIAVTGTGTAFAADKPVKTENTAAAPAPANEKDSEKKVPLYYGQVKKLSEGVMVVEEASVIWEKEADAKAAKDNKDAKSAKTTKDNKDEAPDFETAAMKWKLAGNITEIVIDKDTKFVKEIPASEDKAEQKADAKDAKAVKDAKATKEAKDTKNKDAKADAAQKTNAKTDEELTESIELKDIKEGSLVKITLKDDKSLTAVKVLVLSDVKEVKPDSDKNEKITKTEDNKAAAGSDAKKADEKKDASGKT